MFLGQNQIVRFELIEKTLGSSYPSEWSPTHLPLLSLFFYMRVEKASINMNNNLFEKSWAFYNQSISKGLKPMGQYINGTTPMDFQCLECGEYVHIQPRGIKVKTGYGCRACVYKKEEETFIQEMSQINPNIEFTTSYKNNKTKIGCKCKICGYEFMKKPNDLLSGHFACPNCIGYNRMTTEEFYDKLKQLNLSFDVYGDYINRRTPLKCICKKDGYEWNAYPADILAGRCGCARCSNKEQYTPDRFREIMQDINPNIEIIGDYINSREPILCRCKACGLFWKADPGNLKNSLTGCPQCRNFKSKGEEFVKKYLNDHNIVYELYKRFDDLVGIGGKPLSYDFYLPDYHLLIECQGLQHYCPIEYFGGEECFNIQQEHDNRKRAYAHDNGYNLLEIPYYDNKNISDILNSFLYDNYLKAI